MTPSLLGPVASVAEADRMLESLDQMARSGSSDSDFWRHFLAVIQGITSSNAVSVLNPVRLDWVPAATLGPLPASHLRGMDQAIRDSHQRRAVEGKDSEGTWIAASIDPGKPESGILLISYGPKAPETLLESGRLLLDPFCEILQRRCDDIRSKFDALWHQRLEACIRSLSQANAPRQVHQVLVDQMVLAVQGARASMVVREGGGKKGFRLECSSGASIVDRTSSTVKRLEQLAESASRNPSTLSWSDRSPTHRSDREIGSEETTDSHRDRFGIFLHGLAIGWDRSADGTPISWILLEWLDHNAMARSIPLLSSWCNTVYHVWLQQDRWTQVSPAIRERLRRKPVSFFSKAGGWLRRLLAIAAVIALLWGLTLPYPMTIESKAVLEPVERRLIHASADGYVAELLVDDGDRVVAQQELARLRSPSLDLQIEETMGRLRAFAEKRNGIKVAINQLSPTAPDTLANQTRLSTELLMLDTNESHAREMLSFFQTEQNRLVLRSPIDGIVVAKQLRQELENRPIRRGDPILQIVDLSGNWQLRIQVADRDTAYVDRYYADRGAGRIERQVSYIFDSLPSEEFVAEISEISRVIENRDGTGGFQEALATINRSDASRAHMGATARVRFSCGREPFGYVWSRPLIEFLQKKFRLFSWPQTSTPNTLMDHQ